MNPRTRRLRKLRRKWLRDWEDGWLLLEVLRRGQAGREARLRWVCFWGPHWTAWAKRIQRSRWVLL